MNIYKEGICTVHLSRQEVIAAIQLYVKERSGHVLFIPDIEGAVDVAMGSVGNIQLTIKVSQ
jgi:hypothetical protein